MKIDWKKAAPIFVLGILLGAVGGSWTQRAMMRHWKKSPDASRRVEKLSRQLKLDAGQKDAVKVLLEADRVKFAALHDELMARFKTLRGESRTEIRKLLTPEQQVKFDEMTARLDARSKHR
ncbi:MAG: hypothetical protein A2506_06015 [Elusimicrobia bacterium RIFOXYD12_FULL_66_9]|nr:MAG: hypothetical protein A2506_06015 [Elusimicrobia bacterium RIFOXYD12_FULL_66_9]